MRKMKGSDDEIDEGMRSAEIGDKIDAGIR